MLLTASLANAEVKEINNEEIAKLIKNNVPIVDIRRPSEWSDTGVIAGSNLLTFFDKRAIMMLKNGLPNLKKLLKRVTQL